MDDGRWIAEFLGQFTLEFGGGNVGSKREMQMGEIR